MASKLIGYILIEAISDDCTYAFEEILEDIVYTTKVAAEQALKSYGTNSDLAIKEVIII